MSHPPHVVAGRLTRVEMVLCKHWCPIPGSAGPRVAPSSLAVCTVSCPPHVPSHTNFHHLTPVWTNPHPAHPEIAAHAAPPSCRTSLPFSRAAAALPPPCWEVLAGSQQDGVGVRKIWGDVFLSWEESQTAVRWSSINYAPREDFI